MLDAYDPDTLPLADSAISADVLTAAESEAAFQPDYEPDEETATVKGDESSEDDSDDDSSPDVTVLSSNVAEPGNPDSISQDLRDYQANLRQEIEKSKVVSVAQTEPVASTSSTEPMDTGTDWTEVPKSRSVKPQQRSSLPPAATNPPKSGAEASDGPRIRPRLTNELDRVNMSMLTDHIRKIWRVPEDRGIAGDFGHRTTKKTRDAACISFSESKAQFIPDWKTYLTSPNDYLRLIDYIRRCIPSDEASKAGCMACRRNLYDQALVSYNDAKVAGTASSATYNTLMSI